MRITCDLLSTIMPPTPSLPGDFCRPDYPPLLHLLNPMVHAGPTKAPREEVKNNA